MASFVGKKNGYLYIAVGTVLFIAAATGAQPVFFGVGVAFVVIGAAKVRKTK